MCRLVVKETLHRNKVKIALIQESKLSDMSEKIAREVQGKLLLGLQAVACCFGIVTMFQ